MRRHRRTASLVATLALVGAAVQAPAASAATPLVGAGSFARTIPFIDGYLYPFECHAVAPGASSTTVSSCTLGTTSAPPVTSQGGFAATYQAVSRASSATQVCWTVSAQYPDSTSQTKSGCSASSAIGGAGAG